MEKLVTKVRPNLGLEENQRPDPDPRDMLKTVLDTDTEENMGHGLPPDKKEMYIYVKNKMYIYFGLAAIAIFILALSIFAKNTAIFRMFFPGIHEPFEPEDLEVKDLLVPEKKRTQNNSIP